MPLLRYFVGAGGFLLALLILANSLMSGGDDRRPTSLQSADKYAIQIVSLRKGPERVVIDTAVPATSVQAVVDADAAAAAAPAPAVPTSLREARAELPAAGPAKPAVVSTEARLRPQRPAQRHVAADSHHGKARSRQVADVFAPFWIR